jgi:dCTP diphosphatase
MDYKKVFDQLASFVAERDWSQFHTPENLAKSIVIEAGELLENYQWAESEDLEAIRQELADVLTYCYLLAKHYDLDPNVLILEKLETTKLKYPIEKSKGNSRKYDQL